ncbi:MAG TPA: DivIVA domain-containing protein [Actinomycetota bacterium]|nr:DivIVA domain-containing protein [Actinomycetota bacterium]
MDLTARDVNEKQFHDAWRGYNQEEVDDFLDRVAETLERLQRENAALQQRISELDQAVAGSRDTEEMLKKTLVTAQHAAEEAVAKAKARAGELVAEAEERLRRVDEEIETRVAHAEEESRTKIAQAERDLDRARRELDERSTRIADFEAEAKTRLKAFFEQQLAALEALGERPPDAARPPGEVRTGPWARSEAPPAPAADADAPDAAVPPAQPAEDDATVHGLFSRDQG